MKIKAFVTLLTILPLITVYAQDTQEVQQAQAVEKSLINIQTGLFGAWAGYERGLSNTITIKAEAGIDAGFYYSFITDKTVFMAGPSVNIEPRWYYNIKKRTDKGRNTSNNGGNFVGLSLKYLPDWFTISNNENLNIADQLLIVPKWSIRRNIGNSHFNYEAGIGLGVQYAFLKQYGYYEDAIEPYLDFHVRIGYSF